MDRQSSEDSYLMAKVGDKNRYQLLIFITFFIQYLPWGSIEQSYGLLFQQSKPVCPKHLISTQMSCQQFLCTLKKNQRFQYYPQIIDSLANSTGELFICEDAYQIPFLEISIPIGYIVGLLFISYFNDNFGRKFTLRISYALMIIGQSLILLGGNIYVIFFGFLVQSAGYSQIIPVSMVILRQQCAPQLENYYLILLMFSPTCGGLITGIVWRFLPFWRITLILVLVLPTAISFVLMLLIQQSPRYLIQNNPQEALAALQRIAIINGKSIQQAKQLLSFEEIQILKLKYNNPVQSDSKIIDLFKQPTIRFPLLFLSLILSSIHIIYIGPSMAISELGMDAFTNQMMIQITDFIGNLLSLYLVFSSRKKIGLVSFMFAALTCLFLAYDRRNGLASQYNMYLSLVLNCIMKCLVSIYFNIYYLQLNQQFPIAVSGICFGFIHIVSYLTDILIPYVLKWFELRQITPFVFFGIASVIALISLLPLKQTLENQLKEEIDIN